ncbi:CDP-diacylglycerol--serine O-phosphatidyltransferase [Clostridium cavendishii DSM 21758]|uniref:CDP-diacylglycerol--serine O-phosphatidyltransferase n=1 Tax=Clostridium cavendishii DSM 21758 TaxID=1121302 RepID=A0A1M6MVZ7_9CLOT|nr:CDP-diacylglycerol--serine O-phosphatidyltransferase [Clostridium cavendishii]SHJ87570.1 CDP-diacylglycerol--serine O-phosphatidyltransferase [Clostridium cavendishii DSM 21758]
MRKSSIPNIFTYINLSFGILSIVATYENQFFFAALFIICAALVDRYDGRVARFLNVSSDLGKELDSLADLVSFGVAPAVLTFISYGFKEVGILGYALMLIFPICGAFRLARFNSTEFDGSFRGVPITIAGSVIAAFDLITTKMGIVAGKPTIWPILLMILFSYLMVSKLELKKF